MWVPEYGSNGKQTGGTTNVVYSVDLVQGINVFSVDLPGKRFGLDPVTSPGRRTAPAEMSTAALPVGVLAGALVVSAAVRRRARRGEA
jgi:hypothetical protein